MVKIITHGLTQEKVRNILASAGYYKNGDNLNQALENFQADLGIGNDHIVGQITAYALKLAQKEEGFIDVGEVGKPTIDPKIVEAVHQFIAHHNSEVKTHAKKMLEASAAKIKQVSGFEVYSGSLMGKGSDPKNSSPLEFSVMQLEGLNQKSSGDKHHWFAIGFGNPRDKKSNEYVGKAEAYQMMQKQFDYKLKEIDKVIVKEGNREYNLGDAFRKMAPNQQDAFMMLVYTMDINKVHKDPSDDFKNSHLAHAIVNEDYKEAEQWMRRYDSAHNAITGKLEFDPGLNRRSFYQAELFAGNYSGAFSYLKNWKEIKGDDAKRLDSYCEYYYKASVEHARHLTESTTEKPSPGTAFAALPPAPPTPSK